MAQLAVDLPRTFDYPNVRLLPAECQLLSRSEADVSMKLGDRRFNLPVVPANMSTVIDEKLAYWLATNGYFYVHHRFKVDPVKFTKEMHQQGLYSSISLGVNISDANFVNTLSEMEENPEYITIDIAHGDSKTVTDLIKFIRSTLPNSFIIAGNIGTASGTKRLEEAGAHAIKVGIAPGSACLTGPQTGFGTRDWQLSAVEWCSNAADEALIIADGGIKVNGDIAKSIAFGADMVMVGSMLAAHDENPGELINRDGNLFKSYFGSASEHQKGEKKHIEGTKLEIPHRGPIANTLLDIKESLQSSVSYAGGRRLLDLRNVEYVLV
jgi:GMP reductase